MNKCYPYAYRRMWTHREWIILNVYNDINLGNSLNVCICIMMAKTNEGSHWWKVGITFIKHLEDCAASHMPNPGTRE